MMSYTLELEPGAGYFITFTRDGVWYDERCNEHAVDPLDEREAHRIARSMLARYCASVTQ
jgi:hypothetical protein